MPLRIQELNHVAIHVRDLDASIRFYRDILELPVLQRPAFGFGGAWFALGNQQLHLIEETDLSPAERRHHHFALLVEDAFAARAELERRGVTDLQGPRPRPDGPMQLFFHDPDGYRIEMYSTVSDKKPVGGSNVTA